MTIDDIESCIGHIQSKIYDTQSYLDNELDPKISQYIEDIANIEYDLSELEVELKDKTEILEDLQGERSDMERGISELWEEYEYYSSLLD